jgi:hypothetical protein
MEAAIPCEVIEDFSIAFVYVVWGRGRTPIYWSTHFQHANNMAAVDTGDEKLIPD